MGTNDVIDDFIERLDLADIRVEREQLITDAHDQVIAKPHLKAFAEGLSEPRWQADALLDAIDDAPAFLQATEGACLLRCVQVQRGIRAFIRDCILMELRMSHPIGKMMNTSELRTADIYLESLIEEHVIDRLNAIPASTPPPIGIDTVMISVPRFEARLKSGLRKCAELLREELQFLEEEFGPEHETIMKQRETLAWQEEQERIILEILSGIEHPAEARMSGQAFMTNVYTQAQSLARDCATQITKRIGDLAASMLGEGAARNEPGYIDCNHEKERQEVQLILTQRYRTALRRFIETT